MIVELGAGTHVPTVRVTSERAADSLGATLVRINLREPDVPRGGWRGAAGVGLALGALDALRRLDAQVSESEGLPEG